MLSTIHFGAVLKECRLDARLTQVELAARAQVGVRTIIELEGGRSRPRADTVKLLADDGLGLTGVARDRFLAAARGRPVVATAPAGPDTLPRDLPAFVGREREVAELRMQVRHERMVTLTGPGGVGKSRLALESLRGLLGDFAAGVYLVDLAPLRDPGLVAATIASALGLAATGISPIEERLIAQLQGRRVLLLLDNCGHLTDAVPLVSRLLERCAMLTVLATSRSRLQLPHERPCPVPPLRLPDRRLTPASAIVADYEAVALFLLRARFARRGVPLSDAGTARAAEICRLLGGLPLALELAAARCDTLNLVEMHAGLAACVGAPARRRGPAGRHPSLRAALSWTYELLTPAAQMLFGRLAVFAGGWTLAAAEAIAAPTGEPDTATLDGLQELVQQNLVRARLTPAGTMRYTMLDPIHEYARERLRADPTIFRRARKRHWDYFLALAERYDPSPTLLEQPVELAALEHELDNFRAALRRLGRGGETAAALRLAELLSAREE